MLAAGEFNQLVISSAEVFMGILLGGPVGLGGWLLRTCLPGTGSLVGVVTLLGIGQSARASRERGQAPACRRVG